MGEAQDRLGKLHNAKESLLSALARVGDQEREIYAAAALGRLVKQEPGEAAGAVGERKRGRTSGSVGPDAEKAGASSGATGETDKFGVLPDQWSWTSVGGKRGRCD